MRYGSILVVFVLLVLGAALVWWTTSEPPRAPEIVDATPTSGPRADVDTPADVAMPSPTVTDSAQREESKADVAASDGELTLPKPDDVSWSIRIVDAESNAPLAGARVWLVPRETLFDSRWPEAQLLVPDPLVVLNDVEPLGTSRADGTIEVPMPLTPHVLAASVPGAFGAEAADARPRMIQRENRVRELRVFRDATLRVEVVDAGGTARPFVPVDLVTHPMASSSRAGSVVHRTLPVPGSSVAEIPHARWRLHGGGHAYFDEFGSYAVRPGITGIDVDEVGVEPASLDGAPLRLVVPPCAAIRIRVMQSDGSPWKGGGRVETSGEWWDSDARRLVRDSEALFFAVGADAPFVGNLIVQDQRFPAIPIKDLGPRVPWVETVIVAQLPAPGEGRPLLTGRLLNADGSPAAGLECFIHHARPTDERVGRARREPPRFTTDESGRFVVPYGDAGELRARVLVPTDATRGRLGYRPEVAAALTLPDPLSPGTHDLGDLTLHPLGTLVAGRVTTAAGTPLEDVELIVEFRDDYSLPPVTGPNGAAIARGTARRIIAKSAADGSFAIHGAETLETVRITARRVHVTLDPLDVAAYRTDVAVVFPTPGWIRGHVLCDDGVPIERLEVSCAYDVTLNGGRKGTKVPRRPCRADGSFEIELDTAESARVRMHAGASTGSLFELEGARSSEAPPGDPFVASDPRLESIDLRGRLRVIRGRVVDANERPLKQAQIADDGNGRASSDADGRFVWLSTDAAPRLTVSHPLYRSVQLVADTIDVTVKLTEPSTRLVVSLPADLDIDAFTALTVYVEEATDAPKPRVVAMHDLEDRKATLLIAESGVFRVRMLMAPKGSFRRVLEGFSIPLQVESSEPIELELPLTQALLDAAAKGP